MLCNRAGFHPYTGATYKTWPFSQPTAGIRSDEPGLPTPTGNVIPFQEWHTIPGDTSGVTGKSSFVHDGLRKSARGAGNPIQPEGGWNTSDVSWVWTIRPGFNLFFQELSHKPHVGGNAIQTQRRCRCQTTGRMT